MTRGPLELCHINVILLKNMLNILPRRNHDHSSVLVLTILDHISKALYYKKPTNLYKDNQFQNIHFIFLR